MKTVNGPEDLETTFQEAAAEARSAFGDDRLYLEHFIPNARIVLAMPFICSNVIVPCSVAIRR
jgi:acetyl/propionyl-CoA carboxylase alpha subunit